MSIEEQREHLARIFDNWKPGAEPLQSNVTHLAPAHLAELVAKAEAFLNERVIELATKESVREAYDAVKAGVDPTLLIREAFKRAFKRALSETAAALRSGEI